MSKLVECVPNFSEGQNQSVIDAIAEVIRQTSGVMLLDVDVGKATNRSVFTFVGQPEPVIEAAYAAIARAAQLIDMRKHRGEHARQGATDVCPLIPIQDITADECVALAHQLAERVGQTLNIPVYLYEAAATRPERKNLADIRAGEYEALCDKLTKPEWRPDYGPATFNATAGATVIGVRPFLVAYNVNLNTKNVKVAKDIGLEIREKGRAAKDAQGNKQYDAAGELIRTPGLPQCRSTGWFIPEYGRAQVTINLLDYQVTGLHHAFDRVCELAAHYGARVTGSEIVGLVPKSALTAAGRHYLARQGMTTGVSDGELIDAAVLSLGLSDTSPFDPMQKIIEYRVATPTPLASMPVAQFIETLGSNAPAPGGGSVAALAGAMSAALVSMVAALTYGKAGYEQHNDEMIQLGTAAQKLRDGLQRAIDDDTAAFNEVMRCMKLPKATEAQAQLRQVALLAAEKRASDVPMSVLKMTSELWPLIDKCVALGNQNSCSDAGVAGLMAAAAAWGACYNVLINLKGADPMRTAALKYAQLGEQQHLAIRQRMMQKLQEQ